MIPALTIAAAYLLAYVYARTARLWARIKARRHYPRLPARLAIKLKIGCFGERRLECAFGDGADSYAEPDDYRGAWHKLAGRTHGFLKLPRQGSTRHVWRKHPTKPGRIQLAVRTEVDGEYPYEPEAIREVEPGERFTVLVAGTGWPLGPYFGGIHPAPLPIGVRLK